jgi:hypothetical protein
VIGVAFGMLAGYCGDGRPVSHASNGATQSLFLVVMFFLTVLGQPSECRDHPADTDMAGVCASGARRNQRCASRLSRPPWRQDRVTGILWYHILPNHASRIVVLTVIRWGHVMLASGLGKVGVQP